MRARTTAKDGDKYTRVRRETGRLGGAELCVRGTPSVSDSTRARRANNKEGDGKMRRQRGRERERERESVGGGGWKRGTERARNASWLRFD